MRLANLKSINPIRNLWAFDRNCIGNDRGTSQGAKGERRRGVGYYRACEAVPTTRAGRTNIERSVAAFPPVIWSYFLPLLSSLGMSGYR